MKKSLLAKIASVGLGLSMVCGGGRISAETPEETTIASEEVSDKSRLLALLLNFPAAFTLGFLNASYFYQGKNLKGIFCGGPIPIIYNTAHLLAGTQTDAEGKKITKWW